MLLTASNTFVYMPCEAAPSTVVSFRGNILLQYPQLPCLTACIQLADI